MMKNLPHFLLISGNGQNVGKTKLASELIRHHTATTDVMAIKISPHRHPLPPETVYISRTAGYEIIRETFINNKDSSRLLQSGANPSIYIQCKDEYLAEAITMILPLTQGKAVICESGGLTTYFTPGISIYLNDVRKESMKSLSHQPDFIIPSQDAMFEFPHHHIRFYNEQWIKG